MDGDPHKNILCYQNHKLENIVTYFNDYAVLITRCKYCKKEIGRKIYRAKQYAS